MADALKLFGTRDPVAPIRRLQAGRLTADLVSGNLRAVSFAGVEVLRSIAYVVRDRDWGTYDPPVLDLDVEDVEDRFRVRYRAEITAPDGARLAYTAEIEGRADGTLRFAVEAVRKATSRPTAAASAFSTRSRASRERRSTWNTPTAHARPRGFRMRSSRGNRSRRSAPSPIIRRPAFARRAEWRATPSRWRTARLVGCLVQDLCPPLARPWPYRMADGVANRQAVTLTIDASHDAVPASPAPTGGPGRCAARRPLGEAMPRFGLAIAPEETADILARPDRLASLAPAFLLFHFDPLAGHGAGRWRRSPASPPSCRRSSPSSNSWCPAKATRRCELEDAARRVRAAGFRPQTLVVGPAPTGARRRRAAPGRRARRSTRSTGPPAPLFRGCGSAAACSPTSPN